MEQTITTLKFESLEDRELTVINGIFKLFQMLALDEDEQSRVIKYLDDRMKK